MGEYEGPGDFGIDCDGCDKPIGHEQGPHTCKSCSDCLCKHCMNPGLDQCISCESYEEEMKYHE